jgi:small nuclear ribonucleoprotein (snRNP)-like protein
MNLVLADVEEQYTVIIKVPREKQQQQQQQQQGGAGQPTGNSCSSAHGTGVPLIHQQQQQQQWDEEQQQWDEQQQQEGMQQKADFPQQQLQQLQQQQQQGKVGAAGRLRVRWCRKQVQRCRHLDQVLIVGDNVVLVSGQPPAAALASDASKQGMKL